MSFHHGVKFNYISSSEKTPSQNQKTEAHTDVNSVSRTTYTTNQCFMNSRLASNLTSRSKQPKQVIKRKNQLKPTCKINLNIIKKEHEDLESVSSLSYNAVKPRIGIAKYLFCGMDKGQGIDGCQCFKQPCKWYQAWTRSYQPKHKALYESLKKQKQDQKVVKQIQKDLPRTYPDCPTYSLNYQYREKLRNILNVYSVYDMQVGYVQGMNMIAAILLYHIKKEEETFWALVDLMDQRELRLVFLNEFQVLKNHAKNIIFIVKTKIFDLFTLMQKLDILPESFLYGWILSLMSTCIPLQFMHLVLQKFRVQGWTFFYKLVVTYLLFVKEALMTSTDAAQFLQQVNNVHSKQHGIHWKEMIENCHKIQLGK